MFKTFMASLVILTAALPATVSAEIGPGLDHTEVASRPESYVCTNDRDGRLSMRTHPRKNSRKIQEIPNGREVNVIASKYNRRERFSWLNVSYNDGNSVLAGWVRSDYVCGD